MAGIDPREIKLMTMAEVASQFGVLPATVYQWTMDGCPSINKNGNMMFLLKDVLLWKRGFVK